jgi:radical SAM superfamily enzyme YgiQ (UPF0313 family)
MDAIFLTCCVSVNKTNIFRPLGSYQVAWYLRKHGYNTQVVDFIHFYTEAQIIKLLETHITSKTKIIGLGVMMDLKDPSNGEIIKKIENVFHTIKKRYPHIKRIVGSPAAPYFSRLHRNKTLFDYVFLGHTEQHVLALLDHLSKNSLHPQFEIIEGNRVIRESFSVPSGEIFDIETCDHQWHKSDYVQPKETLPLELGRGCIFKCKFCRYPYIGKSKKDFNRSMDCIKQEIIANYENWGVTNYYMLDDTFNADQERLQAFTNMVKTLPFKINYSTYLRIDLLAAHPESEDMLLENGLKGAFLGIESFNKDAANLIGKSWSAKNSKDYLLELYHNKWKEKIAITTAFICGIPPETFEDCKNTNQWLIENNIPSWIWQNLTVYKDAHNEHRSEFDRDSEKYGFIWEMKEGRYVWRTEYCDAITAREWRLQLVNESKDYQKLNVWSLISIGSFDLDIDEYQKYRIIDIDWNAMSQLRNKFLRNYYYEVLGKPSVVSI